MTPRCDPSHDDSADDDDQFEVSRASPSRAAGWPFLAELHERLARFGLELHPDKTRLIESGYWLRQRPRRRVTVSKHAEPGPEQVDDAPQLSRVPFEDQSSAGGQTLGESGQHSCPGHVCGDKVVRGRFMRLS